jgi:predicted nucleotidyltransferase
MHRTTVEEGLILLALTGSQAYGTAIATSDCDYKGVFIAPKDYYLGFKSIEQKDSGWATESGTGNFPILDGVKDCVVYELRKFLTLVGNNNPNIEGLKDGVLKVNRKKAGDADYLLSIRQGDVPYEEVKEVAENLFQEIQGVSTTLPKQMDREFLNCVCVELVERASRASRL